MALTAIEAIEAISALFSDADKVRDMLFELQHDCIIAGGAALYALNPNARKTPIGDVDLFMKLRRDAEQQRVALETLLAIVLFYFPEAVSRFQVLDLKAKGELSVVNIHLPGENIELQIIRSTFRSGYPAAFLSAFDADYVQCGITNGECIVTPECQAAWDDGVIHKIVPNIKPSRMVKISAKGFLVPYFGDYPCGESASVKSWYEEYRAQIPREDKSVWFGGKSFTWYAAQPTDFMFTLHNPSIISLVPDQWKLNGATFHGLRLQTDERDPASAFTAQCASIELSIVDVNDAEVCNVFLHLDPAHKNTSVIRSVFECVVCAPRFDYHTMPRNKPVSAIVCAYKSLDGLTNRLRVLDIWATDSLAHTCISIAPSFAAPTAAP